MAQRTIECTPAHQGPGGKPYRTLRRELDSKLHVAFDRIKGHWSDGNLSLFQGASNSLTSDGSTCFEAERPPLDPEAGRNLAPRIAAGS
jgi:hypothetical protein